MKKAFIYVIKNIKNNKVYIGQTKVNVKIRWEEHLRHSKYGKYLINRAMRKHGKENFYIEILEECAITDVDEKEIYYIKTFDSTNPRLGYNISLGGETPLLKRPVYDLNKAMKLYKNNKSLFYISKLLNVSRYILRQDLVNKGVKIRDRYHYNRKCNLISKEQILQVRDTKLSMRAAAKFFNIPYSTFRNACKYYNIEYNLSTSAQHPTKDENVC